MTASDRGRVLQYRSMKLFFDARYIRTDFHDGISRFSTELAAEVVHMADVTFLICDEAQSAYLPKGANILTLHRPTSVREPFTAFILNKHRPDVVFSPLQTMGSIGRNFKLILTSHDMIYYHFRTPPQQFSPLLRASWFLYHLTYIPQRLALNGADTVVTVSETTKKEFIRTRLTKRPIVVVPNAPRRLADSPAAHKKAPRSLVYMGSFMPYKNVETLVKALMFLPDHTLHLLSRISPERKAQLKAHAPRGAHVIFHNGVSDDEYATLLKNNAILVSASQYEGYGLPVAEGLALGVPAVLSDIPIFHEVAGEGALFATATDPEAFAKHITSLDDTEVRNALVKKGTAHIAQYSWTDSATRLVKAAESLLTSVTIK